MLGLDTNVVMRLLVMDDAEQTRRARKLIEQSLDREEPVLVSLLVLIESEWVLRSSYGFKRDAVLNMFRALLEARELTFEDEPAVEEALFYWKDSACGFADCLITAHNRQLGCRATATFGAAGRAPSARIARNIATEQWPRRSRAVLSGTPTWTRREAK